MSRKYLEAQHQAMLVRWFRMQYPSLLLFAIPNGGRRDLKEAKSLVLGGVVSGIPDLFLAKAADGLHGLFIEFKRPLVTGIPKPVVSQNQKKTIVLLRGEGYRVEVCYGFDEAKEVVNSYLNEKE